LKSAKDQQAKTILERGGSHIFQTDELLRAEYEKWGYRGIGISKSNIDRSLQEFDSTDFIMVPSQYNVDSFVARGVPGEKMLLLPLGVNSNRFKPNLNIPDQPFRALFVGQVSLRKGIQYVLSAWRKAQLANAELLIVGEIKADAAEMVRLYRDDRTIRWLGHVSDTVPIYQSAHVFIFPSIEEGSALVTYEAMACGLPSLVTHNAGSLVRDRLDGFIVPVGDSDALSERLCWLHDHPDARLGLARSARAAIESMTWDRYGESLLRFYQRCIGLAA
jgi:glycosyltransferase involved in cell wall biosynthesis